MGGYPPHGQSPGGGVPRPGGALIDRTAPVVAGRWEVGVHVGSDGKGGGGF